MKPVAPYIGGKRALAARLVKRIEAVPHTTYAEPFVGMGDVFLRRKQVAKVEIINDIRLRPGGGSLAGRGVSTWRWFLMGEAWRDPLALVVLIAWRLLLEPGPELSLSGPRPVCDEQLILVDEASHLTWHALEMLRALSDIGGTAVVPVGTDLLARRLIEAKVRVYLTATTTADRGEEDHDDADRQSRQDDGLCPLTPCFGADIIRKVAKRFLSLSRGYWQAALELADACTRLIDSEESMTALDKRVAETAATFTAGAGA